MRERVVITLKSFLASKCVLDGNTPDAEKQADSIIQMGDDLYEFKACLLHYQEALDNGKVLEAPKMFRDAVRKELGLPELPE